MSDRDDYRGSEVDALSGSTYELVLERSPRGTVSLNVYSLAEGDLGLYVASSLRGEELERFARSLALELGIPLGDTASPEPAPEPVRLAFARVPNVTIQLEDVDPAVLAILFGKAHA